MHSESAAIDDTFEHTWRFPLTRTHTGVPLGNARLGALVWGEGNVLCITLGRADWWDRRGGKAWNDEMTFANIRRMLEAGDEAEIRRVFSEAPAQSGWPRRSSVLPLGRVELVFPEDVRIEAATLDMGRGELSVCAGRPLATIDLSPDAPVLRLRLASGAPVPTPRFVPSWHHVGDYLKSISFAPPAMREDGWTQTTPADATLTVACRPVAEGEWRIAVVLGEDLTAALASSFEGRAAWWTDYWRRTPRISVPNERWRFLYRYGLYRFAGLTAPQGVAATLQGPWIEEYQMPPWQSDYHFNVNVQMCYAPAYQAGLYEYLLPLFRLVESWLPRLRENARKFAGIDDGFLLPHAVDDRCGIIGAFWTGTIDHACTAWVAKMMYDYWNYTRDADFLRRLAFPFMAGAMRVYEAMIEHGPDGALSLPVSVSPEYRGAAMNAWGRDASFQLAACHWLAGALETAAAILGETSRPFWRAVLEKLPPAALHDAGAGPEIALWDGLVLGESHRHFSHFGALFPFDTMTPDDSRQEPALRRGYRRWVGEGTGLWAGWSMPWAAMLHARFGNPDMTELTIDIWERIFTNEGHASLYQPNTGGFSVTGGPQVHATKLGEIMQIEAAMGVTASIMDALVHTRRGVVHLFPGAPSRWADCSFEDIRVEGGFLVCARRAEGRVTEATIKAPAAGRLLLAEPWRSPDETSAAPRVITLDLRAGETRRLTFASTQISSS